jgi:acyl-CoA thioester hydrolase
MPKLFSVVRRVEFCETDAAGIAHFSSILQYAEQAEHAFLRHLGTSVVSPTNASGEIISWPRVRIESDFKGTARFEEELDISVHIDGLGTKSITYSFEVSHADKPIAAIRFVNVCCRVDQLGNIESIKIPDHLRAKFERYLADTKA